MPENSIGLCHTKPEVLAKRVGGGYSEVAPSVIKAIHTNQEKLVIVNVPNRGAIGSLPDDAVVEIPCLVNVSGVHGLNAPEVPRLCGASSLPPRIMNS